MKTRLFSLLVVVIISVSTLSGCQAATTVESAGRSVERGVESAGDMLNQAAETTATAASGKHVNLTLTVEEAQGIAPKHAGFTADQVTALHTEYEIEHGIPQYDVEFNHGNWEYDYEIHADTGEICPIAKMIDQMREGAAITV